MSQSLGNARAAEMNAIHLLTHPEEIGVYLSQKRFSEVADLADYVERDVPHDLAQTDPALYRTLRKAVTELHVRGYGDLNSQVLRSLTPEKFPREHP